MPWGSCLEIPAKFPDSVSHSKDLSGRKYGAQALRFEASFSEQVLENPVGHLCVVRRQTDFLKISVAIRQIMVDVTMRPRPIARQHGLRRVSQGVSNRKPEQHALGTIGEVNIQKKLLRRCIQPVAPADPRGASAH